MAKQDLLNGETRLNFRTYLNNMFTELYNLITTTATSIAGLTSNITTLNTTTSDLNTKATAAEVSIATLEVAVNSLQNTGATSVIASVALAPATITTTPAQLTYFNGVPLQAGSFTTASIPAQTITVASNGYYKIYGGIVAEFPQTDQLTLRLYKNGVPATPAFSQQGLGTGKPVIMNYSTILQLTAGDVLTVYASASASISVTVTGASVNFEKTIY